MTRDEKWDRLWLAACGVVSAYETSREPRGASLNALAATRLNEQCALLKRAVDEICPDAPSAADASPKE